MRALKPRARRVALTHASVCTFIFAAAAYETEFTTLFNRDLDLIAAMGANAVRLHGFMGVADGGARHEAFLEAAAARNISVLLTYELIGVRLFTSTDRAAAIADLR